MKAGGNKQRAFKAEELRRLFAHLEQLAAKPEDAHLMWLPLVALFTGARVNEICQLNPQTDIGEEEGIAFFHFTASTEGDSRIRKSVKNAASDRRVPIHSALLNGAFMEYVKAMKAVEVKLLFPQWKPGHDKASDSAELWFIGVLKEIGLRDDTPGHRLVGMHAFRSTFLNRAQNLRVEGAEWITGHVGKQSTVVRGYLGELELQHKRDIIEKITFDVGLSRCLKAPGAVDK
jgi:integrase